MPLNACSCRVHSLGIPRYHLFHLWPLLSDTNGKYIGPLLPVVPDINLLPFLSKSTLHCLLCYNQDGPYKYLNSTMLEEGIGGTPEEKWFLFLVPVCLARLAPAPPTALPALTQQHTWVLQHQQPSVTESTWHLPLGILP